MYHSTSRHCELQRSNIFEKNAKYLGLMLSIWVVVNIETSSPAPSPLETINPSSAPSSTPTVAAYDSVCEVDHLAETIVTLIVEELAPSPFSTKRA